jgi:NHL repeat
MADPPDSDSPTLTAGFILLSGSADGNERVSIIIENSSLMGSFTISVLPHDPGREPEVPCLRSPATLKHLAMSSDPVMISEPALNLGPYKGILSRMTLCSAQPHWPLLCNGQFTNPFGIAIDSSNNVWVVDYAGNRVQEFNSSGSYLL